MKQWISNMSNTLSAGFNKKFGRTKLQLEAKAPEILLGIGLIGFVGTVVVACRETVKSEEILDQHREAMNQHKEAKKIAEENPKDYVYDEELYQRDILITYCKTTVNLVKNYMPSVALGTLSVACILKSRNILQGRYLGALAAYNGLSEAFKQYRKRVIDEDGAEMDRHYMYGTEITHEKITEVDENGKKIKKEVTTENTDFQYPDVCSVVFDEHNKNWERNPQLSMLFLRAQTSILNDKYHEKGHMFLNEVLDALGFEENPLGGMVGWFDDGSGDSYIDFGLYDLDKNNVRRFINGEEDAIILEFNHDGIIWDKLMERQKKTSGY